MAFCTKCGAAVAEGSTFCGSCGRPVNSSANATPAGPGPALPASSAGGLTPNVAGMLAYFTFIPALLFLLIEPYNRDRFVRFHAFQSLFFNVAWIALWVVAAVIGMIFAVVPMVGWMMAVLLHAVIWLGMLVLWVLLLVKAYQNEKFQLPVIGDLAEKMAAQ
jgi:uncharacterized membrane protein